MTKNQAIALLKAHVASVVQSKRELGGSHASAANQIEAQWVNSFERIDQQLTDADFADIADDIEMVELAQHALGELY
ncbi:MAG: hypothetical protein ACYCWB_16020 [Thiobacillus sp.]